MSAIKNLRIALVLPTVELGAYWKPVLKSLNHLSKETILYTGRPWRNFDDADKDSFNVQVIGETKRITSNTDKTDYSGGFMVLSPMIISYLFKFKPDVIITSGFSIWTILILLARPISRWKVILAWEGSSPSVDFRGSRSRSFLRYTIAQSANTIITNSQKGKEYLVDFLGVSSDAVTVHPYMVPDTKTLLTDKRKSNKTISNEKSNSPSFLYVGRIEQRKGLHQLLKACAALKKITSAPFTLLIIGDGPEREKLESFAHKSNLSQNIEWIGWINYDEIGTYFDLADIFVFPTLEDTWGMVVLEAMSLNLPILCSKLAGASEVVLDRENGYVFDPNVPEELAKYMKDFIDNPDLASEMGEQSSRLISSYNPESVANFLIQTAQKCVV